MNAVLTIRFNTNLGEFDVLQETDKAVLVFIISGEEWIEGRQMWLPKSVMKSVKLDHKHDTTAFFTARVDSWFVTAKRTEYGG